MRLQDIQATYDIDTEKAVELFRAMQWLRAINALVNAVQSKASVRHDDAKMGSLLLEGFRHSSGEWRVRLVSRSFSTEVTGHSGDDREAMLMAYELRGCFTLSVLGDATRKKAELDRLIRKLDPYVEDF